VTHSIHSPEYVRFRELLVEARNAAGLTQRALAEKLGKPRSYVSKVETGERRLDVVEYLDYVGALGVDPFRLLRKLRRDSR